MAQRRTDLDVLRAIAILLALGWHFNDTRTGWPALDALLWPGHVLGWAGVDVFFVLSGFLIGGLMLDELHRTGGFDVRRFLARRALKIWPVLYAYVALLVITGRCHWADIVPATLLHLQNYWKTPVSHLWSLAVEEHFYLLIALLFAVVGSRGSQQVGGWAASALVVAPLLRLAAWACDVAPVDIQWQSHYRVDSLACGVGLAWCRLHRPVLFARCSRRKAVLLLLVMAGALALASWRDRPAMRLTAGFSIAHLTGAALLLLLYDARAHSGFRHVGSVLAAIGRSSYPIYVFQFVPYRAAETLLSQTGLVIGPVARLGVAYGGAIGLGMVVSRLFEQPLLRLRDRGEGTPRTGLPGLLEAAPVKPAARRATADSNG